jgi:hypothetical protein
VALTEPQADLNSGANLVKPGFNSDPRILREIVTAEAAKLGCEAVEFGIWVGNNQIATMALGDSMTGVPARTDMHDRIGGIAETFMSTLLLILVKQQRIDLDWTIANFAFGFAVSNGWILQNPSINRYSGAFGYNMPNGVTITLETTKGPGSTDDAAAFEILREVVKYVTPTSPIAF